MALRLLEPCEGARNMGNLVWLEDLEKRGLSYGDLLGFLEGLHWKCVCSPIHDRDVYTVDDVKGWKKRHTDKETHEITEEDLQRCPEVGAPKKKHIHVYHCFKGPRKPKDVAKYWDYRAAFRSGPRLGCYSPLLRAHGRAEQGTVRPLLYSWLFQRRHLGNLGCKQLQQVLKPD